MESTGTESLEDLLFGGAVTLTRLHAVEISSRRVEIEARTGRWLLDPVVGVVRSGLAVGLDEASGATLVVDSEPNKWPISQSIRIDFVADPPTDGSAVTIRGHEVARTDDTGTTRGEAADGAGRRLAVIVQRSHRIVADREELPAGGPIEIGSEDASLRETLGIAETSPGTIEMPGKLIGSNPLGNVHGGIQIVGMEFAAMSALGAVGELRTASIDIAYVRPASASGTTVFRADVLHRGRTVSLVRATAINSDGKPAAHATLTIINS